MICVSGGCFIFLIFLSMFNFLKYISCIFFSLLLLICSISEDKHTEYVVDLVNRHKNEVKLSEFISKIKIVKLNKENSNLDSISAFIGIASKLVYKNNKVYILDGRGRGVVKIFNEDGNFLGAITLPIEFENSSVSIVDDFEVDNEGKVYLLNRQNAFIKIFNSNLKVSKTLKLKFSASKFLLTESTRNFYFVKNYQAINFEDTTFFYNIIKTDLEGKFMEGILPFRILPNSERNIFSANEPLSAANGKVYYLKMFSDTIYDIQESFIKIGYKVRFKNKVLRLHEYNPNTLGKLALEGKIKEALGISYFNETDLFNFFSYVEDSKKKFYFKDKRNKIEFSTDMIKDDTFYKEYIIPFPLKIEGKKMISVLDESFILDYSPQLENNNAMKPIIEDIKSNASTYLVFLTSK